MAFGTFELQCMSCPNSGAGREKKIVFWHTYSLPSLPTPYVWDPSSLAKPILTMYRTGALVPRSRLSAQPSTKKESAKKQALIKGTSTTCCGCPSHSQLGVNLLLACQGQTSVTCLNT